MTGSGWSYACRAMLWLPIAIVTLGFACPWQMAALERYKFRRTFYGALPARFEATGWQLFTRVWWVWLLGLLAPVILIGASVVAAVAQQRGVPKGSPIMTGFGLLLIFGFFLCIALPFLHAARKAMEWRWWAGGIRFGDAAVRCDLPASGLMGLYWTTIGLIVLVVLAFIIIGGAGRLVHLHGCEAGGFVRHDGGASVGVGGDWLRRVAIHHLDAAQLLPRKETNRAL